MIFVKFTVLFEDPFYIGIIEKQLNKDYYACRVVFGSEPSDALIYEFIKISYIKLKFNLAEKANKKSVQKKINPKRIQRVVSREIETTRSIKKAKDALKQSYESFKENKKADNSKIKAIKKQEKYEMMQLKKKEKKKGH